MKRRVLSVLLCAGLVVSVLAGCGSDDAKLEEILAAKNVAAMFHVKHCLEEAA